MQRRRFISLVGATAVTWPLAARAQQARHVPVIGYVAPSDPLIPSRSTAAFLQRLRELGWIEGQTITIETRWAAGHPERLDEIAAEKTIVQAIVTMAHALKLRVVAEGVETEAQRDILAELECDDIQGFVHSRPLAVDAATRLLS